MLIALPQEHRRNFFRLMQLAGRLEKNEPASGDDSRSHYGFCLLSFYALESGLKYLLNKKEFVPLRHQIDDDTRSEIAVEDFGHDIHAMAVRLKVPARAGYTKLANSFQLDGGYKPNGTKQSFGIKSAHEAWRYGLTVRKSDQIVIQDGLVKLMEWVKEEA